MQRARRLIAVGIAMVVAVMMLSTAGSVGATTSVKDYAEGLDGYETRALFSVGDTVPRTGAASQSYRMVGIPDGLGAHATRDGATLYMNHELTGSTTSQPVVDGPLYRGAIVSTFELDADGDPRLGRPRVPPRLPGSDPGRSDRDQHQLDARVLALLLRVSGRAC